MNYNGSAYRLVGARLRFTVLIVIQNDELLKLKYYVVANWICKKAYSKIVYSNFYFGKTIKSLSVIISKFIFKCLICV